MKINHAHRFIPDPNGYSRRGGRSYLTFSCSCGKTKTVQAPGLRKTAISPRSKKEAKRVRAYNRQARGMEPICAKCHTIEKLERHHPKGRIGDHLYHWIYLCEPCHRWVHEVDPKRAYETGWLQPEYKKRPPNPNHPNPYLKFL